jgi:hypothetical protein
VVDSGFSDIPKMGRCMSSAKIVLVPKRHFPPLNGSWLKLPMKLAGKDSVRVLRIEKSWRACGPTGKGWNDGVPQVFHDRGYSSDDGRRL